MQLNTIFQEQSSIFNTRMEFLEEKRHVMTCQHETERQKLDDTQSLHWQKKQQEWQQRFNKGVRGLFDRITGKRKTIEKHINQDSWHVKIHQQQQRDALTFNQLETRRTLQSRIERLGALKSFRLDELDHDVSQYQDMREQRIEQLEKQRQEQNRNRPEPRQRGPDWTH